MGENKSLTNEKKKKVGLITLSLERERVDLAERFGEEASR